MKKRTNRLGDGIKRERERLGLSTAALASQAGCSEANIRLIEKGSVPSVYLAANILSALNLKATIGHTRGRRGLQI